jgi:hypothetical protein
MKRVILFFIIYGINTRTIKNEDWVLKENVVKEIFNSIKSFSELNYNRSIHRIKEPYQILQRELPKKLNDKGIDTTLCSSKVFIELLADFDEILNQKREFFMDIPKYAKQFWLSSATDEKKNHEMNQTRVLLSERKEEMLELIKDHRSSKGIFSRAITCGYPFTDNDWGIFFDDEERFAIAISEITKERKKKEMLEFDDDEEPYVSPLETSTINIYEITERASNIFSLLEYALSMVIFYEYFEEILYNYYEKMTDEEMFDFIVFMSCLFVKETQYFHVLQLNLTLDLKKNNKEFIKELNKVGILKNIDPEIFPILDYTPLGLVQFFIALLVLIYI